MDLEARNTLVLSMLRLYYWLAHRHVERPSDREDAVQSAVVELLARAHEYDPAKEEASKWAARIARRAFRQMNRPDSYRTSGLLSDPADDRQQRPEEIVYDKELCERVAARLDELPRFTSDMIRKNVIGFKVSIRRIAYLMRMPEEFGHAQQGGPQLAGGLGPSALNPAWNSPMPSEYWKTW